ncbi:MAG: 23S rRNA (adenine(2503)-C(2))-methyltransferase RlmN [Desulfofustis sp.]|nr:23S rRNA (adenine(2503)-C(2))-methyltransferase RlmN [Desulfofustis sp.]
MKKHLIDCKDLDRNGLEAFAESLGQPAFRGRQIMAWLYRPGIDSFGQMTDLAKAFRALLPENAKISRFSDPITEVSEDGSIKFGFKLDDGQIIESVNIPEPDRNTLCISSQVGCAMGCRFCQTGSMGYRRNLSPAEMVNQVCGVRDYLSDPVRNQEDTSQTITNLVFMGMGEPLNNMDNLLTTISILTDQKGLDLASRRITVSTCGIVPQMHLLGKLTNVNLAVSLHAVDNETRDQLMPINRRYPIEKLLQACKDYPIQKRKRIMIEYIMLDGINDSDAEAQRLASILRPVPCKINLLAYNECQGGNYRTSPRRRILAFQNILRKAHYSVFIRSSRGSDIAAACGQLSTVLSESA